MLAYWAVYVLHDIILLGDIAYDTMLSIPDFIPALVKLATRNNYNLQKITADMFGYLYMSKKFCTITTRTDISQALAAFVQTSFPELYLRATSLMFNVILRWTSLRRHLILLGVVDSLIAIANVSTREGVSRLAFKILLLLGLEEANVEVRVQSFLIGPYIANLTANIYLNENISEEIILLALMIRSPAHRLFIIHHCSELMDFLKRHIDYFAAIMAAPNDASSIRNKDTAMRNCHYVCRLLSSLSFGEEGIAVLLSGGIDTSLILFLSATAKYLDDYHVGPDRNAVGLVRPFLSFFSRPDIQNEVSIFSPVLTSEVNKLKSDSSIITDLSEKSFALDTGESSNATEAETEVRWCDTGRTHDIEDPKDLPETANEILEPFVENHPMPLQTFLPLDYVAQPPFHQELVCQTTRDRTTELIPLCPGTGILANITPVMPSRKFHYDVTNLNTLPSTMHAVDSPDTINDVIVEGSDVIVEGSDVIVEVSNVTVKGSDVVVEGSDVIVEGSDVIVEGSDFIVEGSDVVVEVSNVTVEDVLEVSDVVVEVSNVTVEGSDVVVEVSNVTVKGSDVVVEVSNVTVEGSDVVVEGSDVVVEGSVPRARRTRSRPEAVQWSQTEDEHTAGFVDGMNFSVIGSDFRLPGFEGMPGYEDSNTGIRELYGNLSASHPDVFSPRSRWLPSTTSGRNTPRTPARTPRSSVPVIPGLA